MKTIFGWDRWRPALALAVLVAGLSVLVAACGSSNNDKTTSSSGGGGGATTAKKAGDVTKCGTKPGTKATGIADQGRRDRHQAAGHGLHRRRHDGAGVLHLRQRERRHQRPPDLVQGLHRADQPVPDRGLRAQADPDRQGGRHRRRLQPHRVRRRPQVLGVARHLRARRRHRARVLGHLQQRRPEHGPALQLGRRPAGRRARGGEEDRLRPVERSGHRVHRRRAPRPWPRA